MFIFENIWKKTLIGQVLLCLENHGNDQSWQDRRYTACSSKLKKRKSHDDDDVDDDDGDDSDDDDDDDDDDDQSWQDRYFPAWSQHILPTCTQRGLAEHGNIFLQFHILFQHASCVCAQCTDRVLAHHISFEYFFSYT